MSQECQGSKRCRTRQKGAGVGGDKFRIATYISSCLMTRMVVVRHVAKNHKVHLVFTVRVDLDGAVIAAGDMGPDRFAEVADF